MIPLHGLVAVCEDLQVVVLMVVAFLVSVMVVSV